MKRKRVAGRVTFAKSPLPEDEVVARHLRKRLIQSATCGGWQDHFLERPPRRDRVDGVAPARTGEKT